MPLASNIRLPERYSVTRHIASGGMASVWEVEDLLLGRVVAVKVLGAHYAADPGARDRFAREARSAARAGDHPHVATIYDIGEHDEDAFIVMEYFSGGTIADRLRASGDGAPVERETALRWLREAAAGLDHAHRTGVVHRDVKPANLLLDGRDRLAVGDFGIARLADDTQMTQTGQVLGTATYLSPEQAVGKTATAASDRYALALVAYELLTGTRPFPGGTAAAMLRQHAEARPARASEAADLPRAVDGAFGRALAKDPDDRPATAGEFVDELERALAAREATETTRAMGPIAAGAAAAGAAAGAGAAAAAGSEPAEPTPPAAADRAQRSAEPAPPAPAGRRAEPAPAAPDGGRRRRSPLAVVGVAAVAAGVVLAIALASGGGGERSASATIPPTAGSRSPTTGAAAQPTATSSSPAPDAQPEPDPEPGGQAGDPAALNDRGFALLQSGDYAGAVSPLRSSVQGYRDAGRTDELGYAYALYNLGVALNRSGEPEAAVEVLEERMKYPNQRGTVRNELRDAQAKVKGAGKADKENDGGDGEERGD